MLRIIFKSLRGAVLISAVFLAGLIWGDQATGMTFERLTVDVESALSLDPDTGSAKIKTGSGEIEFSGNWEIRKISEQQFHVRRPEWREFYWNVDIVQHRVLKVTGGRFGLPGGKGIPLNRAVADYTTKDRNGQPIVPRLEFTFLSASLAYDPQDGSVRFTADGIELINGKELEVTCLKSGQRELCQIRHRTWNKKFWEVSLKERKVAWATEGEFGSAEGQRQPLFMGRVVVLNPRNVAGTFEDLGFTEHNETRRPRSAWIESRKALYRDLLGNDSYDVLIVPFQVQGYAIDRVGRSLMTRYLADRIARTTNLRVPDPTLVARAFGEESRTLDEDEIFRLANNLKVKLLIRGSVGHNRDEKLKLTLLVQEADENGFSPATKSTRLDWQEIPFSDEHLPEAVFNEMLGDVTTKLPVKSARKPTQSAEFGKSAITLPVNIEQLTAVKPASPVIAAYYLQFLAMLFPEDSTAMEHLFERSLIVLQQISPESTDFRLLKSRALFYLHRRPAALVALGTPLTLEEKGFAAFMNGNLPSLKRAVAEMTSPLPKLMARIELIDLRWAYKERVNTDDYLQVVKALPEWEMLLSRRLQSRDEWYSLSNLVVKEQMDSLFPVLNFTAKDMLTSKIALGDVQPDDPDFALSVHEHYRRFLGGNGKMLLRGYDSQNPTKCDSLDLFHDIGATNLVQGLKIQAYNRGLHEEALEEFGKYEKVYGGHPAMTYLKGTVLSQQWKGKSELNYLLKQRDELYYQSYFWSGGQVKSVYSSNFPAYDADYPQRPFWNVTKGDRAELKGDKLFDTLKLGWPEKSPGQNEYAFNAMKNMLITLKYTNDNFYPLKSGYEWLAKQQGKTEQANTFLELKNGRFEGHPDRIQFDVKLGSSVQNPVQRIKIMEDAISAAPDLWESYKALGDFHINRGELQKARETFLRYPLFKKGAEGSRVKRSNDAFGAAVDIWWRGGVDESVPLFSIAAQSDTGSGAEMMSEVILAMTAGDYAEAASHTLRHIKRYKGSQGYREYMSILHTGGFHQESWSIFNTIDVQSNSPDIWTAAFVGHRMEGKNGEQIAQWLTQDHFNAVDHGYLGRYLLASLIADRAPDRTASELIKETMKRLKNPPEEYTTSFYRPNLAVYAEGFYLLRNNDFDKAYQILEKWVTTLGYTRGDFAVPYLVFSGMKSKNTAKLSGLFNTLEKAYGEPGETTTSKAYYYLAKAYYSGIQGKHPEAMEELRLARYCIPFTGNRPFYPWYQLVETCEWLFKETGFPGYRDLAVEWAKIHQRIKPYFAWAYAVEAKYTESETDRVKALAITLYLDKNSERISGLSDNDKAKALKWLEQHNPFPMNVDNGISNRSSASF